MSGLVVIWSNVGEPKTIPEIRDGDLTGLHEAAPAPPITDPTYDPGLGPAVGGRESNLGYRRIAGQITSPRRRRKGSRSRRW
jgi:hypothetical protein